MHFTPASILVFVGIYLPFQSLLLYVTGAEGVLAIVLKFGSELLLYVVFLFALLTRLKDFKFRASPIDLPIIFLVLVVFIAVEVYSASSAAAINNLRALLRYVVVFYLIYHFGFSLRKWNGFSKIMVVIVVLNVCLSLAQFALHGVDQDALRIEGKVRVSLGDDVEIHHQGKQEKIGAVQGMQESAGVLGAFLIASFAIVLARIYGGIARNRILLQFLLVLMLLTSLLTYSKSGFLLSCMTILAFGYYFNPKLRKLILGTSFVSVLVFGAVFILISSSVEHLFAKKESISVLSNLVNLFSEQYWHHFFAAERGWVIKEVGSQILMSMPLVGYSTDPVTAKHMIVEASNGNLQRLITYTPFEDVYWVALFGYLGIFGMLLLVYIFVSLHRKAAALLKYSKRNGDRAVMAISSAYLALQFVILPYCFFERALEINVFSFYFWLMAGIVVRLHNDYLARGNNVPGLKVVGA